MSSQTASPLGDGAKMIAFLPLIALRVLFSGVAIGFVEGVSAPIMPTGRAISTRPFCGISLITPTEGVFFKSLRRPKVFR